MFGNQRLSGFIHRNLLTSQPPYIENSSDTTNFRLIQISIQIISSILYDTNCPTVHNTPHIVGMLRHYVITSCVLTKLKAARQNMILCMSFFSKLSLHFVPSCFSLPLLLHSSFQILHLFLLYIVLFPSLSILLSALFPFSCSANH